MDDESGHQFILFCKACYEADLNRAKLLFENGHFDINRLCIPNLILFAAMFDHCAVLDYLLSKGARVNPRDEVKLVKCASINAGLLHSLVSAGVCYNTREPIYHMSMLELSIRFKNQDDAVKLVNAHVEIEDEMVHLACANGCSIVLQCLIDAGKSIETVHNYKTPLVEACINNSVDCVHVLLSTGAQPNHVTSDIEHPGTSPLCIASANGNIAIVVALLSMNADINLICGGMNRTALFAAVRANQLQMVQELLGRGANRSITDPQGHTPLDIATMRRYTAISQILEEHKL